MGKPQPTPPDWTGERLLEAGLDTHVHPPLRRRIRGRASGLSTWLAARTPGFVLRPALGFAAGRVRNSALGRRARANLNTALGRQTSEQEREAILRACFAHGARQAQEWLRLSRGADPQTSQGAWIENAVQIDASVEQLARQNNGAIVVTAHLGNWELLAAALRRHGFEGAVVGRVNRKDSNAAWLPRLRQGYGVTTLPQDSAPRSLLRVLRSKQTLGLLCDLEVRRLDGEFLPFFGTPALTMTAPAALARASGLPLLPARCVLPPGAGPTTPYQLSFEEPIPAPCKASGRDGIMAVLRRLLDIYEAWILESPEQWAWHQHRWRTRPGEYNAVPLAERRRIDMEKLRLAR